MTDINGDQMHVRLFTQDCLEVTFNQVVLQVICVMRYIVGSILKIK